MIDLLPAPLEASRARSLSRTGMAMLVTGFLVFFFGTVFAAVTGAMNPVLPALTGFLLLALGAIVFAWADLAKPEAAPSAPTQASSLPVRLVCPSCGAALRSMARSSFVICEYCRTRFASR